MSTGTPKPVVSPKTCRHASPPVDATDLLHEGKAGFSGRIRVACSRGRSNERDSQIAPHAAGS
jgi:hypothetical protein